MLYKRYAYQSSSENGGVDYLIKTIGHTRGCNNVFYQSVHGLTRCTIHTNHPDFSTPYNSTNMASIEAALEALKSLKLGESPNYTLVAKQYGVDRTTLSRRHRGVTGSRTDQISTSRNLNTTQEQELVQYINTLSKRGLPPTRQMIRNFASEIARKPVGKCWVDCFIKRY